MNSAARLARANLDSGAVLPKDEQLLATAKNPAATREELLAVLAACVSWYDHHYILARAVHNLFEHHLSAETFNLAARACRLSTCGTPSSLANRLFDELAPADEPARDIYLHGPGTWEDNRAAAFVAAYPRYRANLWPWFHPAAVA